MHAPDPTPPITPAQTGAGSWRRGVTGGIGYLRPVAQLNSTTRSFGGERSGRPPPRRARRHRWPRLPGRGEARPRRATSARAARIASSPTLAANPPLSRTARRMRKSPTATGTRIPAATVCASSQRGACSSPASNARTIGASPRPEPPPCAAAGPFDPADGAQLGERLPHADEAGAAPGGVDDDVGKRPAELLGELDPHRLLAFEAIGLLEGRDRRTSPRAPPPPGRCARSRR